MCYQNAGEVKKYDAAGNPVLESVKGRNGEIKMISQKIEIGFFNDIKVNVNLIGEMNNVIVKG